MNMSAMFTWAKCLHFGSSETAIITIKRKLRLTHSISHPFWAMSGFTPIEFKQGHQGRRQDSNQCREGCRSLAASCGCFWVCSGDEGRFCQPWSPADSGRSQWFWHDEAGVNGCGLGGVLWPYCSGWRNQCGDCSPYLGWWPWGWGRANGGGQEIRWRLADCWPSAPHWDWDGGGLFARPREERPGAVRLFDSGGCEHGDSQGHALGAHGAHPQAQCWRFSSGCGWTTNRWTKAGRSGACRWWPLPPDLLPRTISTCFSLCLLPTWWTFSTRSSPAVRRLPWQTLDPCWGGEGTWVLHHCQARQGAWQAVGQEVLEAIGEEEGGRVCAPSFTSVASSFSCYWRFGRGFGGSQQDIDSGWPRWDETWSWEKVYWGLSYTGLSAIHVLASHCESTGRWKGMGLDSLETAVERESRHSSQRTAPKRSARLLHGGIGARSRWMQVLPWRWCAPPAWHPGIPRRRSVSSASPRRMRSTTLSRWRACWWMANFGSFASRQTAPTTGRPHPAWTPEIGFKVRPLRDGGGKPSPGRSPPPLRKPAPSLVDLGKKILGLATSVVDKVLESIHRQDKHHPFPPALLAQVRSLVPGSHQDTPFDGQPFFLDHLRAMPEMANDPDSQYFWGPEKWGATGGARTTPQESRHLAYQRRVKRWEPSRCSLGGPTRTWKLCISGDPFRGYSEAIFGGTGYGHGTWSPYGPGSGIHLWMAYRNYAQVLW